MKILKPGKVEMRKFVCEKCGCVFVARKTEMLWTIYGLRKCCPTCGELLGWGDGETYEEHTPTLTDEARLAKLIYSSNAVTSTTALKLSPWLIANGVTFREG